MKKARLFPYFGAKWSAAQRVWELLGDPTCYVEPFAGSLAVLLSRPTDPGPMEIVTDLDGLLVNFWRALRDHPRLVLQFSAGPVSETDLLAQHRHLIKRRPELEARLAADPHYCDLELAGWWWRGISSYLGSGFGIKAARQRPHVDRTLKGVFSAGMTDQRIRYVSARLAGVIVLSGNWVDAWKRGMSYSIINRVDGDFSAFLDPPYTRKTGRQKDLYAQDTALSDSINQHLLSLPPAARVVLAGYEDEYPDLINAGWSAHKWTTPNGYASNDNTRRSTDVLLASPSCAT